MTTSLRSALQSLQGGHGGTHIGAFAVIEIFHIADDAHRLQPMRLAPVFAQPVQHGRQRGTRLDRQGQCRQGIAGIVATANTQGPAGIKRCICKGAACSSLRAWRVRATSPSSCVARTNQLMPLTVSSPKSPARCGKLLPKLTQRRTGARMPLTVFFAGTFLVYRLRQLGGLRLQLRQQRHHGRVITVQHRYALLAKDMCWLMCMPPCCRANPDGLEKCSAPLQPWVQIPCNRATESSTVPAPSFAAAHQHPMQQPAYRARSGRYCPPQPLFGLRVAAIVPSVG